MELYSHMINCNEVDRLPKDFKMINVWLIPPLAMKK